MALDMPLSLFISQLSMQEWGLVLTYMLNSLMVDVLRNGKQFDDILNGANCDIKCSPFQPSIKNIEKSCLCFEIEIK